MKSNNIFSLLMIAVLGLSAISFVSCDDDDDNQPTNALKLSSTQVSVAPNSASSVTIGAGTAPYTVTSSSSKIATATVKDKIITITGVAEGSAYINVVDKNKLLGKIAVLVKELLSLDKTTVSVAVGKTDVVTVSKGTAPYTATSNDKTIATASVKDNKVTVSGVKAGSTTITLTDKNKKTATISVTVSK